jgi:hypothetical protein
VCITIRKKTEDRRLTFYNVMAVLVLLYGFENWAMNRADRRIIETAKIKTVKHVSGRPSEKRDYSTSLKHPYYEWKISRI